MRLVVSAVVIMNRLHVSGVGERRIACQRKLHPRTAERRRHTMIVRLLLDRRSDVCIARCRRPECLRVYEDILHG